MNRFILTIGCGLLIQAAAVAQTPNPAASTSSGLAHALNQAFADVYEKVSPGVVVIEAQEAPPQAVYSQGGGTPLMQFFLQDPDAQRGGAVNQGSGFIMTPDGYILTNSHVLESARSDGLRVTLKDGRKFEAKVVGIDQASDLAVLKINASGLPVVEFGDSDKARVGEFAFALGAPYDLRYTFTYGIISAKGRTDLTPNRRGGYEEYIQTDASINPGNSGGPLVDIDGRVVGVNTLIYGLDQGLGFAIPINIAKKIASQLIADGRAIRAWLGIGIKDLSQMPDLASLYPDYPKGIYVDAIFRGTPASQSDLRPSDIITSADGVAVGSPLDLQKVIFDKQVGDEVELGVWRNNHVVKVKLRTAEHVEGVMPVVNQRFRPAQPDAADAAAGDPSSAQPAQQPPQSWPDAGLQVRKFTAEMAMSMKLQAQEGVIVTSVQPGSAAAAAGVHVGDVITSVATTPVRTRQDFAKAIGAASQGDAVMLNINRGDEKTYAIIKQ
jgi:S1-C subfamily serine protease